MELQELISEIEAKLAKLKAMASGASVEEPSIEEVEESEDEPKTDDEKAEKYFKEMQPDESDLAGGIEKKLKKQSFLAALKKGM